MPTNLLQTNRRMRLLANFLTAFIALTFAIGCASNVNTTNTNTGSTNTSGSPQMGGGKKIEGLEDRPIHISGSSLELRFNYDDYPALSTTSESTIFRSAAHGRISGLVIYNDDNSTPGNPSSGSDISEVVADLPPSMRVISITFRYVIGNQPEVQTVIIRNVPDAASPPRTRIEIEFKRSDGFLANRPEAPNNPSRYKRHFHRRARLIGASVQVEGEPKPREFSFGNRKGTIQLGTAP